MAEQHVGERRRLPWTALAVVGLAWALVLGWRPFVLGFYHDDWTLLTITSPYGASTISAGLYRFLNVALGYVAVSILGTNTVAWHVYGIVAMLTTSVLMFFAARSVLRGVTNEAWSVDLAATVAACFWLVVPWGLGYSAWPVMFPGLWSVGLFLLATIVVTRKRAGWSSLLLASALLVASNLIYEALWLAGIPLTLVVIAVDPLKRWGRGIGWGIALTGAQAVPIVLNRLLTGPSGKQVSSRFVEELQKIADKFADLLGLGPYLSIMIPAVLVAGVGLMLLYLTRRWGVGLLILAALGGMLLSAAIFAAAGYRLTGEGVFSRTYIAVNCWLALLLATVTAWIGGRLHARARTILVGILAIGTLSLGVANAREVGRWAEAWIFQQPLLDTSALDRLAGSAEPIVLVVLLPDRTAKVETLGAFWDTTAAIYTAHPSLRPAIEEGRIWATVARETDWETKWSGGRLTQAWCKSPNSILWDHSASAGFTYDILTDKLSPMPEAWSNGC